MMSGPLEYAGGAARAALSQELRPTPLLIPNLAAVAVLFLPIHSNQAPIGPVLEYAAALLRGHAQKPLEALITGPFLLAIPLVSWTLRLCAASHHPPRAPERWVAWSATLTALAMTGICLGYCVFARFDHFKWALAATTIVLAIAATGLLMIRRLRADYPPALLAMTAAWAGNATLAIFVVLSHSPWRIGMVVGMMAVAGQLVGGIVCVRRWRRAA